MRTHRIGPAALVALCVVASSISALPAGAKSAATVAPRLAVRALDA